MTSSSSSLVDASNNGGKKLYISPKRLHDELTRGCEMTDQLRVMLCEITGGSPPSSPVVAASELLAAQGLAGKIVDTFTQSILMLDEESPTAPVVDSSPARNSEDSGESGKTPVQKDRRGCYKRRKSQKTYTKDTPGSFDDGYAWRKYGQKKILDSKHPRNYYRCTHKYDQNCKAKKHVQQIQENPTLYRTTYDGQHTCSKNNKLAATSRSSPFHQLFTTTSSITHDIHESSSLLWNFQLQPNNYNFTVSIRDKSEINKTPSPSDYNNDTKYSAVNGGGCYMSPGHLKLFDQSDHNQHSLCDRGDVISEVYSCTESTHDSMHQQMHDMLSGGDSAFDDFLMD